MSNPVDGARGRFTDNTELLADVSKAAEIIAPLWPLTSFVAVDPLLGLQHLPFDDATAVARRWLRARTHLTLAAFRQAHERGATTDADLRRAIIEVDSKLASPLTFELGGRTVDAVEIVRLDLLVGPDDKPRETAGDRVGRADVATVRAVSQLV
ncbi:MAG: Na-translocating system protein MpsB, partial [Actinomycetota bacterium]|nr:Na-translocating system protein MpsB [Actinomycetota bacterium]